MLEYYNQNLSKALLDLFPDIGFDKSKFYVRCMFYLFTIILFIQKHLMYGRYMV